MLWGISSYGEGALLGLVLLAASSAAIAATSPGAPIGGEMQVDTATVTAQRWSDVKFGADGTAYVVWSRREAAKPNNYYIWLRRWDASGTLLGLPTKVSTLTTQASEALPRIALTSSGSGIVVWVDSDSAANGIYGQYINADGTRNGTSFLINQREDYNQTSPAVGIDEAGNALVIWQSYYTASGHDIIGRYLPATGSPPNEFVLSLTNRNKAQTDPQISCKPSGGCVATWKDSELASSSSGADIAAQRFDASGAAIGGIFLVNNATSGSQYHPDVAVAADGSFVVVWDSPGDGSRTGIFQRRFSSSGVALAPQSVVNSTTLDNQTWPRIAMDALGRYLVNWEDEVADGSGSGVYAQRLNADGTFFGSQFRVNTTTTNDQIDQRFALDVDGTGFATWTSMGQDGDAEGVYAQRYVGIDPIDISTSLTSAPNPVAHGATFTYTASIHNLTTPSTPTGITSIDQRVGMAEGLGLDLTLPVGATFIGNSGTGWNCGAPASGTLHCNLGTLNAGDSHPLYVQFAAPNASTMLTSTSTVSSSSSDPNSSNDSEAALTTVADFIPDDFSFEAIEDAEASTLYESETVVIGGFDTPLHISVAGGEYRIQTASGWTAWSTTSTTLTPGEGVSVRGISSSSPDAATYVSLEIGGVVGYFEIRTAVPPPEEP